MRVLITGHKGYIGSVLVPLLKLQGYRLIGLDTDLYRDSTFGRIQAGIDEIRKDVRDVEQRDLEGFDAVIHLAGLSNDPLGDLNPDLTYEINYEASLRLAKLAKKAGVQRLIFSSSCSNYGAAGDSIVNEESTLSPVTPYGHSKVFAERALSALADSSFSPTFLRSATVFGLSPRIRFDLVLNNLVAWAFTTGRIYLKSDGTPWRPLVHVEDVCRAFSAVLKAPRSLVHNAVFNVGITEENYQIASLASIVKRVIPDALIEYAEDAGPDMRCYRVDCTKLSETLPEFAPQWNALEGAVQLYEAYKNFGLCLEDFEGPKYKRIDHVKMLIGAGYLDSSLRWQSREQSV